MRDERKTKGQLIGELAALRQRLTDLDSVAAGNSQTEGTGLDQQRVGAAANSRNPVDWPQVYKEVVERIPTGIGIFELEQPEDPGSFRYLYRNPAASYVTRAQLHRGVGTTISESLPALMETELPFIMAEVVRTKETKELGEFRYSDDKIPDTVYSLKVFPLGGPYIGLSLENVTEVKLAEQAREEALTALEAANKEESRRLAGEKTALAEIGRIITSSVNIEEVYERFGEEVRKLIPFDRIFIAILEPEQGMVKVAYVMGPEVKGLRSGDAVPLAGSLTAEVLRTGTRILLTAESEEEVARLSAEFPPLATSFQAGLGSALGLPLLAKNRVIGLLCLQAAAPDAYTPRELDLAEGVAAVISGAVANAQLFESLEASHGRLRQLTQEVVAAQEEERRRVSRELHDEAGQALTALKLSLQLVESELTGGTPAVLERIKGAVALTDATMENIRLLARGLRPLELDAMGLAITLEGYCREFAQLTDISIEYSGFEAPELSDATNICLYRYLQEALTNVAKHSRAQQVRVELSSCNDEVKLTVSDNGRGFARKAYGQGMSKFRGIGLLGMQERFEALGGRIDVESKVGKGTRLAAYVPVRERK